MATSLLVVKGYAAWHTGSVAMLGSLADTGLDLLASLVTGSVHLALLGLALAGLIARRPRRARKRQSS